VDPPERLEQLRVADLGRVEPHLDRLGVAGAVPADLLVAGVGDVAAGVTHRGLHHPVDLAEGRLHTPEASRGECGPLGSVRSLASSMARSIPPVTNVKDVPPCRSRTSLLRWVTTNAGARNGGVSPHGISPPSNMRRPMT